MIRSADGIRGFVFDFDGTIVLSERVHMRAWEDLSAETGFGLPSGFLEESVGVTDLHLVAKLGDAWAGKMSSVEIAEKKKQYYLDRSRSECQLIPGVRQAIQDLSSRGPLAIATSSSMVEVEPILAFFELRSYFKQIHTVETVQHPKPHPEIYLNACRSISCAPGSCVAFEDSIPGAASARSAGCRLVTVATLYEPDVLGDAWFSIRDFNDEVLKQYLMI
jgi:HAD superfamily hydrolase (TIGR01509 family)